MKKLFIVFWGILIFFGACSSKNTVMKAPVYELTQKGKGEKVGYIEVKKIKDGVQIHVMASGLKPGMYGFHLHEKNTMANTMDAEGKVVIGGGLGGHWDPDNTHRHAGPKGNGHRGDLEMLKVEADGRIDQTIISTRIPYDAVKGKSFVIHAMADNYTDQPANGGSGARAYAAAF